LGNQVAQIERGLVLLLLSPSRNSPTWGAQSKSDDKIIDNLKQLKSLAIIIGFIVVAGIVVFGTVYLANHYLTNDNAQSLVVNCQSKRIDHLVTIRNGTVSPKHTQAVLCDRLTITNTDDTSRLMAFGYHDNHVAYDDVTERLLGENDSLTVTLNLVGTYIFHDHNHDEVRGSFTVVQ
jgi:hypothetical protein